MIIFKLKTYSDKELANKKAGILNQAIEHLVKIRITKDYDFNGNKHKTDIFNAFVHPILKHVNKKGDSFNSKSLKKVFYQYTKNYYNPRTLFTTIKNDLEKGNYKLLHRFTKNDIDEAYNILKEIFESSNDEEIIKSKIYELCPE